MMELGFSESLGLQSMLSVPRVRSLSPWIPATYHPFPNTGGQELLSLIIYMKVQKDLILFWKWLNQSSFQWLFFLWPESPFSATARILLTYATFVVIKLCDIYLTRLKTFQSKLIIDTVNCCSDFPILLMVPLTWVQSHFCLPSLWPDPCVHPIHF